MAAKFHPGTVKGDQRRDESGVAAVDLHALLAEHVFEQKIVSAISGIDEGQLSNILGVKQDGTPKVPWVALKHVDAILMALGIHEQLAELVVIPGHLFKDAQQMAYYEFLDENDQPEADEATIMERAEELWAARQMMLSGDPEAVAFVREAFVR